MAMPIVIKDRPEQVIPFLPDVRAGADTSKEELGFLPQTAYEASAVSGKLFVATKIISGVEAYAGHLMFGGIYPNAKVFQLFVPPIFRGHGIARLLLGALKERLISGYWLSIKANVADDLAANSVWGRMGFQTVRTKAGGATRKRQINVRVLDLETPSLFGSTGSPARQSGLRLAERYSQRPIYVFDLNVLFDVIRSESAAKVIWAGMSHTIRLMVAAEFTRELLRTSRDPSNDPILAFASQADHLSRPPEEILSSLIEKLAPAIFPERFRQGILSDRDRSDLAHIATAIHHRAAGFITSENAILRAHARLHGAWNLEVVGVEEFAGMFDSGERDTADSVAEVSSEMFHTRRNQESDLDQARSFLETMHASPVFLHDALACQGTRVQWLLITGALGPLGFAKWDVHGGLKRTADVFLGVDETHHAADTILDYLFDVIPRELCKVGPTVIRLSMPSGQVVTRQAALSSGFLPPHGASGGHSTLQRLAIGQVVSSDNWESVRRALVSVASVSLPAHIPTFAEASRQMLFNTREHDVGMPLSDVERTLSPVLFLFPGRDGVIVPIREQFARDLIGASPQMSMLAPPEASLRRERVYISGSKKVGRMTPGTPVLFYESLKEKGRGCIIAIARITDSRIITKIDALSKVLRRGVLDRRTLEQRSVGREVTETSFDNIFIFQTPVPLKRLRELGCVDGSNLISATSISFEKLMHVVREGRIGG